MPETLWIRCLRVLENELPIAGRLQVGFWGNGACRSSTAARSLPQTRRWPVNREQPELLVIDGHDASGNPSTLSLTNGGLGVGNGIATITLSNGGTLMTTYLNVGTATTLHLNGGVYKQAAGGLVNAISQGGTTHAYIEEQGFTINSNYRSPSEVYAGRPKIGISLAHGGTNTIDGGLAITGSSVVTLTGTNTYNGPTNVQSGVLSAASITRCPVTTWQAKSPSPAARRSADMR